MTSGSPQTGSKCAGIIINMASHLDLRPARAEQSRRSAIVLEAHHVTKDYVTDDERVRALDDITLEVEAGEFVAMVGRSGCGKSTLLNLCGAMDFPTSGQIILDGVATAGLADDDLTRMRREKVGFIFQFFQLIQTLTAVENVELPLLLAGAGTARKKALESLALVEMDGLAGRYPHQLAGGQMQRVAIARALVHGPKLLLADEPTGNLDTATGSAVIELLRRLSAERQVTVLMATHSPEAASVASTVVRLRDGRIEGEQRS
jgi:putative ABC transport system ATP-binding protein